MTIPTTLQEKICDVFKHQSPYLCRKDDVGSLPGSRTDAMKWYSERYSPEKICSALKKNAPFQCTKIAPMSMLQIFSLANSNTQLFFGITMQVAVLILYRMKKVKKFEASDEVTVTKKMLDEMERKLLMKIEEKC